MTWLQRLKKRHSLNQDLEDEIAFHKAMRAGDAQAPPFGSELRVKENVRDLWSFAWVEQLGQDIRYALRGLRRNPAFAATAIVSLALGLGASVAIFTVADNLLLRPMPYRDPSRLVMIWEVMTTRDKKAQNVISPANYLDWKAQSNLFESVTVLRDAISVLTTGGNPEEIQKQLVGAELFPMLGVQPILGRLFTAEEDKPNANPVILISHRLWQRRFGGDPGILGAKVELNATMRTVIGVMPPGFYFRNREADAWEPMNLDTARDWRQAAGRFLLCAARLKPGVSYEQAQTQMETIARRLESDHPRFNKNWTVNVEPLRDSLVRNVKSSLWVLLGAVGLLLAAACANVANLLLARLTSRQREMAVRVSLGAGRWRAARQLLTEGLVLGIAGGVAGLLLARWAVQGLVLLAPRDLTRTANVALDLRILLFAVGLSLVTSALFGLAPALAGSRLDLSNRSGIGGGARLRGWLVGAEVALAVVLLVGAGLLFRTLVGLQSVPSGLQPENLLTFRVSIAAARYPELPRRTQFFQRTIARIEQFPGVRAVSATSYLPFNGMAASTYVGIAGRPDPKPGEGLIATIRTLMPGYFRTMGIPIVRGRDFTAADNVPTVPHRFIVNEAFVRKYMPNEEPLGHQIKALMDNDNPFGEIIGVVGDVKEGSLDKEPSPTVYYNHAHLNHTTMTVVARTGNDPLSLTESVRRAVLEIDAAVPISDVRPMEAILGETYARQRFSAVLLVCFSLTSLLLAAVGIYGVLSYSVSTRTREIGVRVALGAEPGNIARLVVGQGARLILAGAAAGLAGALALSRVLGSLLFSIGPRDPLTFGAVLGMLILVALAAAWLPARRASRLDPMRALRAD